MLFDVAGARLESYWRISGLVAAQVVCEGPKTADSGEGDRPSQMVAILG